MSGFSFPFSLTPSRRFAAAALAVALVLAPAFAEARIGGGSSFGSRGSRTFSAPPVTSTAPRAASPFDRSMTQPSPNAGVFRPGAGAAAGGGFFGGGFGRGLVGGLLGAGLFGMLFGGGMFGGLGGISSIFGLLIQLALIFFLVKLAMNWFARRQPAVAGAAPQGAARSPFGGFGGSTPAGFGGGAASMFGQRAAPQPPATEPLTLAGSDYDVFETRLTDSQAAYTREDVAHLRSISTPEMASYFAEQIADQARRGVINKVTDVRFLKGDLSEAWREPDADYATVAMRFSLLDATYDRTSGRLVDGEATKPQEVAELWTFRRDRGAGQGEWLISGIQQT